MLEDQPFEHLNGGLAILVVELPERLELQLERIVRPRSLSSNSSQSVGRQRDRQTLEHLQGGLCAAGLVALDLRPMHLGDLTERLQSEPAFLA